MARKIKLNKKTTLIIVAVAVVVILAGIFAWRLTQQPASTGVIDPNAPAFDSVLPTGKTIDALGGWRRLDPPNNDVFYVFTDSINNVSINVSQQPIPDSFEDSISSSVDELARDYNATDTFDASGVKVYIGTNANGQQSVIFTKKDLLVLIVSQGRITNDDWKRYIGSLT